MGKKLDALLGRGFKTDKFKTLVNHAISHLAVLKNHHQVRCSQARSDIIQLLNLGHHERAILRVELVIKEQNMLEAFIIIEGYCHLLIERVALIANNKEYCPDELKEAISTLIYAASRCGEFPELQEIRYLFTLRYGKEFDYSAIELRNNCGVNPRIIHKFSTRQQPSLESRMKLLQEIASDQNGITDLKLHQEEPSVTTDQEQNQCKVLITEVIERDELQFSESMKARKQYRDDVSAAQAAFESVSYAEAAGGAAAVELSREKSQDNNDCEDPSTPLDKIHTAESMSSDSEGNDEHREIHFKELEERKNKAELVISQSAYDESDDDEIKSECTISWTASSSTAAIRGDSFL